MKDETIRRGWLLCLIADVLFRFVVFVIVLNQFDLFYNNKIFASRYNSLIGTSTIGLLFTFIGSLFLYFCAYRKPGTKLLTFCLISLGIGVVKDVFALGGMNSLLELANKLNGPAELVSFCYLFIPMIIVDIASGIISIYFFYKLRNLNITTQLGRILANPGYNVAFESMLSATTADDLYIKYGQSVREHPEIARFLKIKFKKKNAQFKNG